MGGGAVHLPESPLPKAAASGAGEGRVWRAGVAAPTAPSQPLTSWEASIQGPPPSLTGATPGLDRVASLRELPAFQMASIAEGTQESLRHLGGGGLSSSSQDSGSGSRNRGP